jgi:hypothetical protein
MPMIMLRTMVPTIALGTCVAGFCVSSHILWHVSKMANGGTWLTDWFVESQGQGCKGYCRMGVLEESCFGKEKVALAGSLTR